MAIDHLLYQPFNQNYFFTIIFIMVNVNFLIIMIINKDRSFKLGTHMYHDILSIIDRNVFFVKVIFLELFDILLKTVKLIHWQATYDLKKKILLIMIEALKVVNI